MTPNYRLTIEGQDRPFDCGQDRPLLKALTENKIVIGADCGGQGTCGKCKVKVMSGQITGPDGTAAKPESDGSYLACQIYPKSDIIISIKELKTSSKGEIKEMDATGILPIITKKVITPVYPTIDNIYSLQEMIKKTLPPETAIINRDNAFLRRLAQILDKGAEVLTVTLFENEVIAVEAGNTEASLFGVAFDIGTTTVAGMLVDLTSKKIIASSSKTNPQTSFGADVISRINAASTEEGLSAQAKIIRQCLNEIIEELCLNTGLSAENIYGCCIAGNSAMSHLFLNISPAALTRLPYVPVFETVSPFYPAEVGLNINPNGRIIVLPNIASFVGSDTTAAIVAVDIDTSSTPKLLVDLGTNGEMALTDGKNLYTCSTAAGPAFEGAHIKDGMRAFEGAISEVKIVDGEINLKVIGNLKPAGICGSGIVMAIAELLKAEVILPSGRFNKPENLPTNLGWRLKTNQNKERFFILCEAGQTAVGRDICLTQGDIRQIQLVKSSILTGIEFLLEKMPEAKGIEVFLAGAFGNYIDVDSALTIGLFPKFETGSVHSVGNAAGAGAVQALLSVDKFKRCLNISNSVKYLELASLPEFQNKFVENLVLG